MAQQSDKAPRIGFLTSFSPDDVPLWRDGFLKGLRELGYTEGRTILIEYRYADGRPERLAALADELVRLKVDIIVTETTPAALAAQRATSAIPIVMTIVADPVASRLVASLGRPGGNITGMSLQLPDLTAKRLQLLYELVPTMSRAGILWNVTSPITRPQYTSAEAIAPVLGIQFDPLGVRGPEDFEKALQSASRRGTTAVLILDDFLVTRYTRRIAELTFKTRLPAIAGITGFGEAGGLASYGPNFPGLSHRAATYVDKILKGAKPSTLPIEQPTSFELVLNLKTARAFGLTIPPALLLRANRVIE